MDTKPSSLVVTYHCLPEMPEHCEIVTTTKRTAPDGHDHAELVVSSSHNATHSEWTDEFLVPIQQTRFSVGELVIGSHTIRM